MLKKGVAKKSKNRKKVPKKVLHQIKKKTVTDPGIEPSTPQS